MSEGAAPSRGAGSVNATRWLAGGDDGQILRADDVSAEAIVARPTGISELDRVLGGGLVPGAVVLIGGDPGIGKSTLLLQVLCALTERGGEDEALYVTGEESLQQVVLRARRLGVPVDNLRLLAETRVEAILAQVAARRPRSLVIDSIQTMYTDALQSAPGSVGQVRESAAQLVRFAKADEQGTTLFLVGHVTKDGALAGPRVLEHMVDTVLYFEAEGDRRFRVIRAIKNRFGAANELGIFAMTEKGLREVANPSAIFLARPEEPVSGSVVTVTREGSRPLLLEIQALVGRIFCRGPAPGGHRPGHQPPRHVARRVEPARDHLHPRAGCVRERGRRCTYRRDGRRFATARGGDIQSAKSALAARTDHVRRGRFDRRDSAGGGWRGASLRSGKARVRASHRAKGQCAAASAERAGGNAGSYFG